MFRHDVGRGTPLAMGCLAFDVCLYRWELLCGFCRGWFLLVFYILRLIFRISLSFLAGVENFKGGFQAALGLLVNYAEPLFGVPP